MFSELIKLCLVEWAFQCIGENHEEKNNRRQNRWMKYFSLPSLCLRFGFFSDYWSEKKIQKQRGKSFSELSVLQLKK